MHHKFVKRIHTIFVQKTSQEGKAEAKRWLSETLKNYQDFLEVREYTYRVLGLNHIKVGQ